MGAEIGATTSLFGYDKKMSDYLSSTDRSEIAEAADGIAEHLTGDPEVYADPEKYFDQVIEIDLSKLEPHINGPFSPDKAWPLSEFADAVKENDYPARLDVGLIGSCTNSSYEDITRSASIARAAMDKGLQSRSEFTITPGSEMVRYTMERDGLLKVFEDIGGVVMANACGPCIGQWARHGADKLGKNSIITSFNRNFAKRNDGNPNTHAFVASPEIVTALVIAGDMTFNPMKDSLTNRNGEQVMLEVPEGLELPAAGFDVEDNGFQAPYEDGSGIEISIAADSERLQLLGEFEPWTGEDLKGMKLLIKVDGKCTTDHISMAGPWLRYRGHLDNISNNLMIGAVNSFNQKTNSVVNQLNGNTQAVPDAARVYKENGVDTIIIGDENYGEGSSREHAAMEPRHLSVRVVLVRSFARIHETNLKKQGMLALTFTDKTDYEKIREDDSIDILGLDSFKPDKNLRIVLTHSDGTKEEFDAGHSYNEKQIEWFRAGSALNLIKQEK
ncbi:Aconitate hydratase A [subsurface metagenome]